MDNHQGGAGSHHRHHHHGGGLGWPWVLLVLISLLVWSAPSEAYKEKSMRVVPKFGRPGGGERVNELMSNGIGEPSCDELRAMWRYHKRQSRAEYTNRVPTFDAVYWQLPPPRGPVIQGFGPLKNNKIMSGRNRARQAGRYSPKPVYGQLNYGPSSPRTTSPRPLDQLIRTLPAKPQLPEDEVPLEPVLLLSPKPTTTSSASSSFNELRQMYLQRQREEQQQQMQMMGQQQQQPESPRGGAAPLEQNYGTMVLSPPQGQDGRVANKPPMLMTPFEKLRFGHVQDLSTTDEIGGELQGDEPFRTAAGEGEVNKRGLFYYPIRATRLKDRVPVTTTASPPSSGVPQASIPSVFSFWRRQLLPQDPPPSIRMVEPLPPCPMVQGLQCVLNSHCDCVGLRLHSCDRGQCRPIPVIEDDLGSYESLFPPELSYRFEDGQ